uniref:Uncharacterized protein n=1 Tax=Ceratitis capitata TaxID=7213 RepID=W8C2N6_CERCA
MPRQRRNKKVHVDIPSRYERHHCPPNRYSLRPSRVFSRATRSPPQIQQQPSAYSPVIRQQIPHSRSRCIRTRQNSRRSTTIDIGNNAVWKTLVHPISILKWLPIRRSVRRRRSRRSRNRRSQRHTSVSSIKVDSRTRAPATEIEMPCCATESPTAETQIHMTATNEDVCSQQRSYEQITPPLSTVILHHNPLFDVEGNTQSGLLGKHFLQMATIDQVKSIWPVQRAQTSKQKVSSSDEIQDATKQHQDAVKKKSKSAMEKRRPAKKDSSEHSMPPSKNPSVSLSTVASSEQSKSDSEESNSYEEKILLAAQDSPGIIVAPLAELCTRSCTQQPRQVLACNNSAEPLTILDLTVPIELNDEPECKGTTTDVETSTNITHSNVEAMLAD